MQRVQLSEARPGTRLGRSIITEDGRVLLPSGVELTEAYIRSLRSHGIESIYLLPPELITAPSQEVVSPQVRQELTGEMRQVMGDISVSYHKASRGLKFPSVAFQTEGLKRAVDRVVSEVLANPRALITLQNIRQVDEYTMLHSIEVCILAVMVGNALGLSRTSLGELALAALLHDIGKTGIPLEILNKPERLTPEETAIMNRHTSLGWALLRSQREISEETAIVALQHHERFAGGGYPLNLAGEQIHRYARVCAVVDVYDALTADRIYRRGLTPAEAIDLMAGPMSPGFEPDVLEAFLSCVAPYPLGLLVELSDGRTGQVVGIDQRRMDRPRILVTEEAGGRAPAEPYAVDLREEPALQVLRRRVDGESELLEEAAN
ncbi:MAG: HD-GYP domain-containing protein [Bacillota bacterium]